MASVVQSYPRLRLSSQFRDFFEDRDYVPPANETRAMRRMRELTFAMLILPPWIMTAVIVGTDHSGAPAAFAGQMTFPEPTSEQIAKFCAEQETKWPVLNWPDPECSR